MVLWSRVSVVSFLLQDVRLLELLPGIQLVNCGSLEGSEDSASRSVSSVSALSVSTFTLNFSAVVVVLEVLVGSEGGVNGVLLLHVKLLSLVPFSGHLVELDGGKYSDCLHTDHCQCSVVVLDVLVGSEGGVNSFLLLHVDLLGLVPLSGHLVELLRGLDLGKVMAVSTFSAFCSVSSAFSTRSFSSNLFWILIF